MKINFSGRADLLQSESFSIKGMELDDIIERVMQSIYDARGAEGSADSVEVPRHEYLDLVVMCNEWRAVQRHWNKEAGEVEMTLLGIPVTIDRSLP